MPTLFKSAALETPIRALERMAEIPGKDLNKEGTGGRVRSGRVVVHAQRPVAAVRLGNISKTGLIHLSRTQNIDSKLE